uniref:aldehyde dehydrogenase family protein n=1 Tax=Photorhabdus sp. RM322S TaxID=3342825 RepID=UPI0036DF968A
MKWFLKEALYIHNTKANDEVINIGAGFGPTGLPHIGTLCEIIRINFVKTELEKLGRKVNFFLVSDDLDPFRKVPANVPLQEELKLYLGKPINQVPDPYGEFNSFSAMAENKLIQLAERYNINCTLIRNSLAYSKGDYNKQLTELIKNYDKINTICMNSTGPLRQRTYSIVMPISPITGNVIEHIKVTNVDWNKGEMTYFIPSSEVINKPGYEYAVELSELYKSEVLDEEQTISVLNGNCKLQWKADWAMRLLSRSIDFEMHGEDLSDSAKVAKEIAEALNAPIPRLYRYGLFLDANGKKISKSKGNGFSLSDAKNLLKKRAIEWYLSKKPQRTLKFHIALAPKLNDSTDEKQSACNIGFAKAVRMLFASKPIDKLSARKFLLLYARKSQSEITDDVINYSYNYHKKTFNYGSNGLSTEHEKQYISTIADNLTTGFACNASELHKFAIDIFIKLFPERQPSEAWNLLNRALFGTIHGPKLKTWFDIVGIEVATKRLQNPILSMDTLLSAKNPAIEQQELLTRNNKEDDQMGSSLLYEDIDFESVKKTCQLFAYALVEKKDHIIEALSSYQCKNVTEDEIKRSTDLLLNIEMNQNYFKKKIYGVTSFLPLNQPIYASVCFGFIPSIMSKDVCIRPPTTMTPHYKRFLNAIDITQYSPSLSVSFAEKENFLSDRVKITDAVIFTGTPENALKVRKHFKKKTLFILNGAGHNPLIVSDDANIEKAVESAKSIVLYNQGQDCAGPNTILVHSKIYKNFKERLLSDLILLENKVGPYSVRENIVGPNSDIDHTIKIASVFKQYRQFCTYGGEVNPINGMIKPTVFEKPIYLGGNYKEFFAPVFFLQEYNTDSDLHLYFSDPQYPNNAMYISLFGTSDYISHQLDEKLHHKESILHNTDLHKEERGFLPYGGQGPAASCIFYDGERFNGSTLPQRDIYTYLVNSI